LAVYIKILQKDLPKEYQKYNLIPTIDGLSQSVYLLDKRYVLKVFKTYTKEEFENEYSLLKLLNNLPIGKIKESFYINNNFSILYNQINGLSLRQIDINHIKQIAIFLRNMHQITINKYSSNKNLFSKNRLYEMVKETKNNQLLSFFNKINITLKNDGIIHGDLFLDNAKFKNNKLSGVFDFCEACNGDFLFDLAVVAISWCYDNNTLNMTKVKVLLNAYRSMISYKSFIPYISYALLYYTTSRYLNNRNYKELLVKLELIFL